MMKGKIITSKTKLYYFITLLLLVINFLFISDSAGAETPRLFFSDLLSGPKKGWNGERTKGAAVTIWGLGFGSHRGSNYVAINGAKLFDDSDYAEWGTTDTANGIPRGLERIVFWLNNNCHDGAGAITVTVNGVASNQLPFTVRSGKIHFVAPNGKDNNNGRTISSPWQHLQKFAELSPGDILYARGGEYISLNHNGANAQILLYNLDGTADNPIALVGYPEEIPWIDESKSGGRVLVRQSDWSGTTSSYLVFSKFKAMNGGPTTFQVVGKHIRIIGNWFENLTTYAAAGIFNTDNSEYVYIYGNYIKNSGSDNWAHVLYGKTKSAIPGESTAYQYFAYNEIDGYIDSAGPHGCGGGMIDIARESDAGPKTSHHIYIHSNLFKNSGGGIFFTEGGLNESTAIHHIYIYNNIVINGTACASKYPYAQIYFHGFASDFYVYNNLFYKSGHPIYGGLVTNYQQPRTGMQWPKYKNNIFVTINNTQPYFVFDGGYGDVYSDHDSYYGSPIPSGSKYYITNAIVPKPGHGFIDENNHNFMLIPGSSLIDAGTSEVSPIVTIDYLGNPRPYGSGYDIGPFEYYK